MREFNKSFYIEVGNRIKTTRESKKLTRDKLSQMTEISDKFLYDIEVGNKGMSADTLWRISQALEVSADWLLGGGDCRCGESEPRGSTARELVGSH
jgi:transcriptional regulator with XRE-family HTH domain